MTPLPAEVPPAKEWGRVLRWFSNNPVYGMVTLVLAAISIVLNIVFGLPVLRSRELSLYVNPTKSTVVKSGQSSDLHVLYKGQSISTDVTALQVAIWNQGKESIRPENILAPVVLSTSPKVPILEARIRHIGRPVSQIDLDTTHLADGRVGVSWKILEHNDGAIIQLIVAGPSTVTVGAEGVLEGQSFVKIVSSSEEHQSTVLAEMLAITALLSIGFVFVFRRFMRTIQGRLDRFARLMMLIIFVSGGLNLCVMFMILFMLARMHPPFPFD